MTQDGPTRSWGSGRLVIAAIIVAFLVLNVLLWRGFGKDHRADGTSWAAAPGTDRPAEQPSSQPPAPMQRAEGVRERERWAAGTSGQDGRNHEASLPAAVDRQASAPGGEPVGSPAPGGRDSSSRSVSAATAAASVRESTQAVPLAPDSRAGSPQVFSSNPQGSTVVSRRGGDTAPAAEVESPRESATPEAKAPVEGEPGSDRTPPVLEALRFDPPVVEDGEVTTLTVQARDDLSGLKSVSGEVRSPNRLATLPFHSRDVGSDGVSTFAITVPRQAESGVWYVSWISLTDGADNSTLVQAPSAEAAPPGATLTVNSSESDSTGPEVLHVGFDKTIVEGGEKNVILVEARDDRSGVASVMGACQSQSKSAIIWFQCAMNAESGTWEGDVPIPRNADCGEWKIQQLAAKDKAGNTTLLMGDSPLLARAGFEVSDRADCDSTPPTLDAFVLSPTSVSNETATEILVTATVHDVGSGAVSMTGWFEGPVSSGGQVPKNYFHCSPDPQDPEAPWTGKILVPQLAPKGTWKVGVIRLQDKAQNFREYTPADSVVSGRVFEVR